ncbi:endo alpha-1,4 polygalactosaminidase [Flavilitoribacter nigricans]|uniref:Glycoside-hydrolase family GH114 TIM-barrel domain-containing protein n=1 Tax=Flavilitoribacter nigricans (strain ATCC 23147 / DSM 23189 / NBRC 102662 / NCIMB 1420 / SS-2) TaxID=1122177 RepID=A0A2D0N6F5_FLAN2|nr:endo alpha-1,4 polygalactosaminidase [Flavilitoribacter nigricans]PHN03968.1 hypothetical protein CRP01_24160 [Flavilitoribacter nigricans DSM 23189 = NBRC 102662]
MNKRILFFLLGAALWSCEKNSNSPVSGDIDFRQEMRQLVQSVSAYGRFLDPDFIIIPQNGEDIITVDGAPEGPLATGYLNAIDGVGREELFYGYNNRDNEATPYAETSFMLPFLNLLQQNGKAIMVTDYTNDPGQQLEASTQCQNRGFVPFIAADRELSLLPDTSLQPALSGKDIIRLDQVESFLFLINPQKFNDRANYIASLATSNYDLLLIDLFFDDQQDPLTIEEILQLRFKPDGTQRLLIAYLSIGEAESYRYYWQSDWDTNKPYWMESKNSQWAGNYKVRYWEQDWKNLLIGNKNSYLKKIVDAGFDGVYLDVVDAYEFFE